MYISAIFPDILNRKRDTFAQRKRTFERCIENLNAFTFSAYDIFSMNNSKTYYTFYRQKDSDRFGLWVKWGEIFKTNDCNSNFNPNC